MPDHRSDVRVDLNADEISFDEVCLLAGKLHPPSVVIFDPQTNKYTIVPKASVEKVLS